jgi:hypothetical protein
MNPELVYYLAQPAAVSRPCRFAANSSLLEPPESASSVMALTMATAVMVNALPTAAASRVGDGWG